MSAVLLEEQDYSVHLDDVLPRMGNGSLVHSAYYDDDEVIDRIAGFIAQHARKATKTTDDIELELAMKELQDFADPLGAIARGTPSQLRFRFQK